MASSLTIPCWEFDLLYASMYEKMRLIYLKEGWEKFLPVTDVKITGYNTEAGKGKKKRVKRIHPTLPDLINAHPKVKAYFAEVDKANKVKDKKRPAEVTDSSLYKQSKVVKDATDPNEAVEVGELNQKAYARFLGFKDLDAFRAKKYVTEEYTGYHFSQKKRSIHPFKLNLTLTPEKFGRMKFDARLLVCLNEFHDVGRENVLRGEFAPFEFTWLAPIQNEAYFLQLMFYTGEATRKARELTKAKLLYGILSGTASRGYLLSTEVVLARGEHAEETVRDIARYLNLRRNHFEVNINDADLEDTRSLKADGVTIKAIEHLAAKKGRAYRIITHPSENTFFQSKFTIEDDYSATIEIEVNDGLVKKFPCALLLDNIGQRRVIVHAYDEESVIYAATNFEFVLPRKRNDIMLGFFSIMDGRHTEVPAGDQFAMRVDSPGFEVKAFRDAEVSELKKDAKAAALIAALK